MSRETAWDLGEDEARRLLALPAADRAVSFFQLIADWEEAWGLRDADGWVVSRETDALPLWPHATLAGACAHGPWEDAAPESVSIDDLLEDLLPLLEEDGLRIAVFPSPDDPGLLLAPGEVRERLERELEIGG
ncbi:MAG TPA: DUF2750 domain-containing protein [Thermoanaerobaculia bacterium]|jgi:hypothetical protein